MWIDRDIRLAKFISVVCEPGWGWNLQTVRDFDLWVIWSGRGWASCGDERFELTPGSVICFRPGNTYNAGHDSSNRMGMCVMHFDVINAAGKVVKLPDRKLPPHVGRVGEIDLYERLLKHAASLYQTGNPLARAEAALHVRGLLGALERSAREPVMSGVQKEYHDAMWAVARSIRENPGDLFSIDLLAEQTHYSADHFSRLFKHVVGVTPKEFCIRARLDRAQTLLRESAMNVEQIAAALGYSDVFFFSRQFKQRAGVSPTQWRARQSATK